MSSRSPHPIIEALRAREDSTLMAMLDEARDEGIEKGQLRALRQTLIRLLGARGFVVDGYVQSRIETCKDGPTLESWIFSVAEGRHVHELMPIVDPP